MVTPRFGSVAESGEAWHVQMRTGNATLPTKAPAYRDSDYGFGKQRLPCGLQGKRRATGAGRTFLDGAVILLA
jgi:hypothetical protein